MALFHLESRKRLCKMLPYSKDDLPGTNVCSSDVEELVEFALNMGWDPDCRGPAFVVPVEGEEFGLLNGFNLREVA